MRMILTGPAMRYGPLRRFCVDTSDEDDTGWKKAMELISGLVSEYLESGLHRTILLNTEAVGIGFVDGDIEILRRAE